MRWCCIIILACHFSCDSSENFSNRASKTDTLRIADTIYVGKTEQEWQKNFGLTHDTNLDTVWFKPVSYYFSDPEFSGLAADFYYGRLRPSDDGTTQELLKLATTDNNKLRPFYRWCLNTTIIIQDGALAEMTGIPARRYAEKFPEEFIAYLRRDSSRYIDWAAAIYYSGYYEDEVNNKPEVIKKKFFYAMRENCNSCNSVVLSQLEKFSESCFLRRER